MSAAKTSRVMASTNGEPTRASGASVGQQGGGMTSVIDDLPYQERLNMLQKIAEALVALLQNAGGQMNVKEALRQLAQRFQTLISQVREGLDYALGKRLVREHDDLLVAA